MFSQFFINDGFAYIYEKKLIDSHTIHILHLEHNKYYAKIVKANNGNIGRETFSSMA